MSSVRVRGAESARLGRALLASLTAAQRRCNIYRMLGRRESEGAGSAWPRVLLGAGAGADPVG
eukprot:4119790-Prymnesium_polylepis.1